MDVSIVIPNFNGRQLLKDNFSHVIHAASSYKDGMVEIIVADDNSQDDSIKVLEQLKRTYNKKIPIVIMQSKKNRGFSTNVNDGVHQAKGEIVVLLNTDVKPYKNFLTPLVKNFADKNVFAVGCMDESLEDKKIVLRGRGIGKWRHGFLLHKAASVEKRESLWASGGSSAFRRSVWNTLGGMNELYNPFYWEDIDLSYRAWKRGYIVLFEPESKVVHQHAKGAIRTSWSAGTIKKIAYRNQILFVWLNITDFKFLLSHFLYLPYHLIKLFLNGDIAFTLAFLQAISVLYKVLIFRQTQTKMFILKDKEILDRIK